MPVLHLFRLSMPGETGSYREMCRHLFTSVYVCSGEVKRQYTSENLQDLRGNTLSKHISPGYYSDLFSTMIKENTFNCLSFRVLHRTIQLYK